MQKNQKNITKTLVWNQPIDKNNNAHVLPLVTVTAASTSPPLSSSSSGVVVVKTVVTTSKYIRFFIKINFLRFFYYLNKLILFKLFKILYFSFAYNKTFIFMWLSKGLLLAGCQRRGGSVRQRAGPEQRSWRLSSAGGGWLLVGRILRSFGRLSARQRRSDIFCIFHNFK